MLIRSYLTRNPNNLGGERFTKYTEKKNKPPQIKMWGRMESFCVVCNVYGDNSDSDMTKRKDGVRISRFVGAEGWDSMKYLIGFKGVQNNLLANLNVAEQLCGSSLQ